MSNYKKIILKNSGVEGATPEPAFLDHGEIALNYADRKLYYKDTLNNIVVHETPYLDVLATPGSVVKRNAEGRAIFNGVDSKISDVGRIALDIENATGIAFAAASNASGNTIQATNSNASGVAARIQATTAGIGAFISSSSGTAAVLSSSSGTASAISSDSGTYHATFGNDAATDRGNNRSFVARERGAFGWLRKNTAGTLTFTARLHPPDTLTADRTYTLPDETGTIALTNHTHDASQISSGIINAARLPSYVDNVLEYANFSAFPVTGETGKIYVAVDTNKTYRWSGTIYIEIANSADLNALAPIVVGFGNAANATNASAVGYQNVASGIAQVETATIVGGVTSAGTLQILVRYTIIPPDLIGPVPTSIKLISVSLTTAQNTALLVAAEIRTALQNTVEITTHYIVGGTGATYSLTAKVPADNDTTLNLAHNKNQISGISGITDSSASVHTVAGSSGTNASAIGTTNTAAAINSVAVGNSNRVKSTGLASVAFGLLNNVDSTATINETTGVISGTIADRATHGKLSTAIGLRNSTGGEQACAVGYNNSASATNSSAIGKGNIVDEVASHSTAVGSGNTVSGAFSTAVGYTNSTAGAGSSTAIGSFNVANTLGTAVGLSNNANNQGATAVGLGNNFLTPALWSSAFGHSNNAYGQYSTAIGSQNTVNAINSMSIGRYNLGLSTAHASINVGILNNTSGTRSIDASTGTILGSVSDPAAHGRLSTAVGILNATLAEGSTAIGYANTASGTNSSAFGNRVITSVAGTQEFGIGTGSARLSSVRVHDDGYVALSLLDTATALTDGGATVGAEADGTLMRSAYALRRSGSGSDLDLFIDTNSSTGTVTTIRVIKGSNEGFVVTNNSTATKTFDAQAATIDTLYKVVATLIQTLQTKGVI